MDYYTDDKKGTAGCLFFLGILVIFLFIIIDWGFLKSEIAKYPALCEEKVDSGQCSELRFTLNPTTYKVSVGRQEVLYWMRDGSDVQKLTKCAVRNRKNWSCRYNDNSAEFGFTNGRFWERVNKEMVSSGTDEMVEKTYYLSRLQWLKLQCDGCSPVEMLFVCFMDNLTALFF